MTMLLSLKTVRNFKILLSERKTPFFSSAVYSVNVYENVTIGAELIRVVASDADSGERGSVRYTLSGTQVQDNQPPPPQQILAVLLYFHRVTSLQWEKHQEGSPWLLDWTEN